MISAKFLKNGGRIQIFFPQKLLEVDGTLRVPWEHGASGRYLFSCVLTYFQHGASMVMTEIPCKTSAMWLEQ